MVTTYVIFDVRCIRVTLVAIRTLYPSNTAQMTNVVIQIFPPFKRLPTLIAVQIGAIEKSCDAFHATNLAFLIARVLQVEDQVPLLGKHLAALRTLCRVRLRTGRRVVPL